VYQQDEPQYLVRMDNLKSFNGRRRAFVEIFTQIDFGSWRDLARHRSVEQMFPWIEPSEYENWYVDQLPDELSEAGYKILDKARYTISMTDIYAVPLAYKVPVYMSGHLDKFEYIFNLRTAQTVHPTLRKCLLRIVDDLNVNFGADIALPPGHCEPNWVVSSKRGTQDIVKK